jgi:hypothetical protein
VGDALVEEIRDALADAVTSGTLLAGLHSMLDRPGQQIFLRFELHLVATLIAEAPTDEAREAACNLLLEEDSLDLAVRHEFAELARVILPQADAAFDTQWIELVKAFRGADDALLRERIANGRAVREVNDEELATVRRRAQQAILAAISEPFPAPVAAWAHELDAEFGPRHEEPDDTPFRVQVGPAGPVSPLSYDEFAAMSPREVLRFARVWTPPEPGFWPPPPSPEGLATQLSQRVKEQPEAFAALAPEVVGLDPTYVRGILQGFELAARDGRPFL